MAMAMVMFFGSYGGGGLGLSDRLGVRVRGDDSPIPPSPDAKWHEDADDEDKRIAAGLVEKLANVRVEKIIGLWYRYDINGVDSLVLFKNAVDGLPWACILHIDLAGVSVSKLYCLV